MPTKLPPETVALVRRRYAEGAPLAALKALTGITSVWTLYRCLDGKLADGSGAPLPLPALPRRRVPGDKAPSRKALVARLWRSAEQQVDQIEARLAKSGRAAEESERDARALATLARALRELSAFDEIDRPTAKTRKRHQPEHDDPIPRDLDELRRELARRMHAFVDSRPRAGMAGGPDE